MTAPRKLKIGSLFVLCVLALCLWYPDAAGQQQEATFRETELQGIVRPAKQVSLNAPVAGVLAELLVTEGQDVAKGDLIARMDDGVQAAAVAVAELRATGTAELRRAELTLKEAEILVERYTEAFRQEAASEWEVRRTRLQRDQAQAQLDSLKEQQAMAKASLQIERERLARFKITAPFAGRVVRKGTEPGATVAQSDRVVLLMALDTLEAELHLPASLYGRFKVGDSLRLASSEPVNRPLTATVKTIDAVIDPASRTFRCVLTIPNPDLAMPAGFTVNLMWPQ